jgi:hypothetical protein
LPLESRSKSISAPTDSATKISLSMDATSSGRWLVPYAVATRTSRGAYRQQSLRQRDKNETFTSCRFELGRIVANYDIHWPWRIKSNTFCRFLRRGFAEGTDGISKSRLWRVSSAITAGDVRNADIPHAILPIENADIAGHGRIDTEEPVVLQVTEDCTEHRGEY